MLQKSTVKELSFCSVQLQKLRILTLSFKNNDRNTLCVHRLLTSYVADLPKTESIFAVSSTSQTFLFSGICVAKRKTFEMFAETYIKILSKLSSICKMQ